MSDISKVRIDNVLYDVKDLTARTAQVPAGGTTGQYLKKTSDTDYATEWGEAIDTEARNSILYFSSGSSNAMAVSPATSAQIGRIPASGTDSRITADHVVLNCVYANPSAITSTVSWRTYDGYVTFTGTCTSATTADVTLGKKGN